MTWLKIDDKRYLHPKWRAAGLYARALWTEAANYCADLETDGHLATHNLAWIAALAEVPAAEVDAAVGRLLEVGLWEVSPGLTGWVFHDWRAHQVTKDYNDARRKKDRKKQALHHPRLQGMRDAVVERDGSACRYCGVELSFAQGKATGTFDHVDPELPAAYENVVAACRSCNSRKGKRTPDDAGMPLLPAPAPAPHRRPGLAAQVIGTAPPAVAAAPEPLPPASPRRPAPKMPAQRARSRPPQPSQSPAPAGPTTTPPTQRGSQQRPAATRTRKATGPPK